MPQAGDSCPWQAEQQQQGSPSRAAPVRQPGVEATSRSLLPSTLAAELASAPAAEAPSWLQRERAGLPRAMCMLPSAACDRPLAQLRSASLHFRHCHASQRRAARLLQS